MQSLDSNKPGSTRIALCAGVGFGERTLQERAGGTSRSAAAASASAAASAASAVGRSGGSRRFETAAAAAASSVAVPAAESDAAVQQIGAAMLGSVEWGLAGGGVALRRYGKRSLAAAGSGAAAVDVRTGVWHFITRSKMAAEGPNAATLPRSQWPLPFEGHVTRAVNSPFLFFFRFSSHSPSPAVHSPPPPLPPLRPSPLFGLPFRLRPLPLSSFSLLLLPRLLRLFLLLLLLLPFHSVPPPHPVRVLGNTIQSKVH